MTFITHARDIPYELIIELKNGNERTDIFYNKAEALKAKRAHAEQGIKATVQPMAD